MHFQSQISEIEQRRTNFWSILNGFYWWCCNGDLYYRFLWYSYRVAEAGDLFRQDIEIFTDLIWFNSNRIIVNFAGLYYNGLRGLRCGGGGSEIREEEGRRCIVYPYKTQRLATVLKFTRTLICKIKTDFDLLKYKYSFNSPVTRMLSAYLSDTYIYENK